MELLSGGTCQRWPQARVPLSFLQHGLAHTRLLFAEGDPRALRRAREDEREGQGTGELAVQHSLKHALTMKCRFPRFLLLVLVFVVACLFYCSCLYAEILLDVFCPSVCLSLYVRHTQTHEPLLCSAVWPGVSLFSFSTHIYVQCRRPAHVVPIAGALCDDLMRVYLYRFHVCSFIHKKSFVMLLESSQNLFHVCHRLGPRYTP